MGLRGVCSSCPAGHHTGLHGPTDYCCDRQQEGAQAEGNLLTEFWSLSQEMKVFKMLNVIVVLILIELTRLMYCMSEAGEGWESLLVVQMGGFAFEQLVVLIT